MKFKVLSPREASIFTCIADAVLSPQPILPPVSDTTAVEYFDNYLAHSPRQNRAGYRAMILACEMAPKISGFGARFRQLDPESRTRFLESWSKSSVPRLRLVFKLIKSLVAMSYYGDDKVLELCGYDAGAKVARGRVLREEENRP